MAAIPLVAQSFGPLEETLVCVEAVSEDGGAAMIRTVARADGRVIKVQLQSVAIEETQSADESRLRAWLIGCRDALPAVMRHGTPFQRSVLTLSETAA